MQRISLTARLPVRSTSTDTVPALLDVQSPVIRRHWHRAPCRSSRGWSANDGDNNSAFR